MIWIAKRRNRPGVCLQADEQSTSTYLSCQKPWSNLPITQKFKFKQDSRMLDSPIYYTSFVAWKIFHSECSRSNFEGRRIVLYGLSTRKIFPIETRGQCSHLISALLLAVWIASLHWFFNQGTNRKNFLFLWKTFTTYPYNSRTTMTIN